MDASNLAVIGSVLLGLIAAIPTIMGLIAQSKKDKKQQELDMNAAALNAATAIIVPLQAELARAQARNIELEQQLINKIKENGQLTQDGIDKDATIRTQKYGMETMQSRLDTYEEMVSDPSDRKDNARAKRKSATRKEDDDRTDEDKKQVVSDRVQHELDDVVSKSTINTNGGTATEEMKQ